MQSAASANVAQSIQSIDAERRPETFNTISDPRPRYADTTAPHLEARPPRPPSIRGTIEQLHPHQRSGSSAVGSTGASDHLGMPPPERPRATRIRECLRRQCFNPLLTIDSKLTDLRNSSAPCCLAGNLTSKCKSLSNSNGDSPNEYTPLSRCPYCGTRSFWPVPQGCRFYSCPEDWQNWYHQVF